MAAFCCVSGREARDRKAGFCSLAHLVRLARSKVSPWALPPSGGGASSPRRPLPQGTTWSAAGSSRKWRGQGPRSRRSPGLLSRLAVQLCVSFGDEKPEEGCGDGGRPGTQESRAARSGSTPETPRWGRAGRSAPHPRESQAGPGRSAPPRNLDGARSVSAPKKPRWGRGGPHPQES